MNKMKRFAGYLIAGAGVAAYSVTSAFAVVDISGITDGQATAVLIGEAALALLVVILGFRLVRKAA